MSDVCAPLQFWLWLELW